MSEPFRHASGPRNAHIAIVGEAWGEQEAMVGKPFVGTAGQELTRLLRDAGISRGECFLTNVFNLRPPGNKIQELCANKKDLGKDYSLPPIITPGHYVRPEFLSHLDRLATELNEVRPNLILAAGNTACWALLRSTKITAIRGYTTEGKLVPFKVLPTFHPSAVLRNWAIRTTVVCDLMKARREAEFPAIQRTPRHVLVNPTFTEVNIWAENVLGHPPPILSIDSETAFGQMSCISFARSRDSAITIPFFPGQYDGSYWPAETEPFVWMIIRQVLESPVPKLFQNGIYDLQYITKMAIRPRNCLHDTMLLHHSLYPELPKSLGFLGSIYCNEQSWKLMRKQEGTKADE